MNSLENEIRATMNDHRLDDPPTVDLPEVKARFWSRTPVVAAAASAVVIVVVVGSIVTSRAFESKHGEGAPITPSATSAAVSTMGQSSASDADTSRGVALLRAMAIGVIVEPDAGQPQDTATTDPGAEWTFTRTRTISKPIKEVVEWYRKNLPFVGAEEPLRSGRAALFPVKRTEEVSQADDFFAAPDLAIRFKENADNSTDIAVTASGTPRGERADDAFIPSSEITSSSMRLTDFRTGKSKVKEVDLDTARKMIDYLNNAPLKPLSTYSGTMNGTIYDVSFIGSSGRQYLAHWNSALAGAGVKLSGVPDSPLVDPDSKFYLLLKSFSG